MNQIERIKVVKIDVVKIEAVKIKVVIRLDKQLECTLIFSKCNKTF